MRKPTADGELRTAAPLQGTLTKVYAAIFHLAAAAARIMQSAMMAFGAMEKRRVLKAPANLALILVQAQT